MLLLFCYPHVPKEIFIPNIFTPNDDGVNDVFFIFGGDLVESIITFEIFDRWGNEVYDAQNFQPNDPANGWDGTFKDEKLSPAVFSYKAFVKYFGG